MVFDDESDGDGEDQDATDQEEVEELDQISELAESVAGEVPTQFINDHQLQMMREGSDTQLQRQSAKNKSDDSVPYESTTDGYQTKDSQDFFRRHDQSKYGG